jgi:hypothetical protein
VFSWMTKDQLNFIIDMTDKHAEAWVEKKYPNVSSKEKKLKSNELKILTYSASQKSAKLDLMTWKNKPVSKLLRNLIDILDDFVDNNQVSEMYLKDAAKWFGFWARSAADNPNVIKDYDTYLDSMRSNKCTNNLFHNNGPMTEKTNKE